MVDVSKACAEDRNDYIQCILKYSECVRQPGKTFQDCVRREVKIPEECEMSRKVYYLCRSKHANPKSRLREI
ncbi:cytochrome c oxidase assembly protein [Acrasis kona]|uniref:Cytochrome c oxidase assembly protein n=1 Tax=Acrasis kona TaxID=1008807 RepID=A0AAW2YZY5_9EUKA